MADLPEGWTVAPISSITLDVLQHVPQADEIFTYIDIGSIDRETKTISTPQTLHGRDAPSRARRKVKVGDILVSMTRPNLNAVALVPPSLDGQIASTGFDVLRPQKGIDPRWLGYLVRTDDFVSAMSELVQGALYPAVRSKDVRSYIAPVAPSAEQTRIADQLDIFLARINACSHRLDAISGLLKRFRQAVLDAAISGDLLAAPSTTSIPLVTMGSVLAESLRNGKSVRDGDGLPVLRLTSLKGSTIDLTETKTGDWTDVPDSKRFLVQNGDYLVSRGNGSKELVGRGGLVLGCSVEIAFPDTMIRMRPDKERLLPDYLKYAWSSQYVRGQIEAAAKTTAGIWKVSQPDLEGIRLPLPQLNEQAEIVRQVEELFRLADSLDAKLDFARVRAQRFTPVILAKAFRGELAPQDPNDEPASVLLKKLTAIGVKRTTPPKRKTQFRRSELPPSSEKSLLQIIAKMGKTEFTFEELRMASSLGYESLKEELFALLSDTKSGVEQYFDATEKTMKLRRVNK